MFKLAISLGVAMISAAGIVWLSIRQPSLAAAPQSSALKSKARGEPSFVERESPLLAFTGSAAGAAADTQASEGTGDRVDLLLRSAAAARAGGRQAEADRMLDEVLEKHSGDERAAQAAVDRAQSLFSESRGTDGEALLRRAVQSSPRKPTGVHATLLLAERCVRQGRLPEAAKALASSLAVNRDGPFEADLKKALDPIARQVYLSPSVSPDVSFTYVVEHGDSIDRLVRTWRQSKGVNVAPGFVSRVNGLADASRIQPGMKLKVPTGVVRIEVAKRAFRLVLLCDDVPILEWRVGLGKEGKTPVGTFVVKDKQVNPNWFRPGSVVPFGDPANPLGTRWMGFEATAAHVGYGIHGTKEPETIGKEMSEGCVRMMNSDVEELFDLVPVGTQVTIVESSSGQE